MIRQILESINEAEPLTPEIVKLEKSLEVRGWHPATEYETDSREDRYGEWETYAYRYWEGPYEGTRLRLEEDEDRIGGVSGRYLQRAYIEIKNIFVGGRDMPLLPAEDKGWLHVEPIDDPTVEGVLSAIDRAVEEYDLKEVKRGKLT